jgi:NAD-dependent DNA ligase
MTEDLGKQKRLETSRLIKSLNVLMGIISGMVSDGVLNDTEILYLKTWCNENRELGGEYPANIIFRRVHEVLIDGVITDEERRHLLNELSVISGNDFANTGAALPEQIASIFDDDPHVIFEGNQFVFTGIFLFGTRAACERAVERRGGFAKNSVTESTNYLVIGDRASPDWITANFGRKIQKAAEMAKSGDYEISIIREADWASRLG